MDRKNYIKNYRSHLCNESRVMWKWGQLTFESRNTSQSRKSCKLFLLKQIHEATTLLDNMILCRICFSYLLRALFGFPREKNLISFSFWVLSPLFHSSQIFACSDSKRKIFASGSTGLSQSERWPELGSRTFSPLCETKIMRQEISAMYSQLHKTQVQLVYTWTNAQNVDSDTLTIRNIWDS